MYRIRKVIMFFLVLFSPLGIIYSQQDPQYTQYMYNTMNVNPAYAGSKGHSVIVGLARVQWLGIKGAPNTQTLSYDTPLDFSGLGFGVNLNNDIIGPSNEIYLDINTSYSIDLGNDSNLSLGLKLGGRQLSVDWSKGSYKDPDLIFSQNISKFLPTVGAGLYYYSESLYLGLSVPNLLRSKHYNDILKTVSTERLHFFFIGGYVFNLSDVLKFKPAFLTKVVKGSPLSLDLSGNFLINNKLTAGLSWRWDDSISALLGIQATKNLNIGFAYDLTTSDYRRYNSGTYELMLRWDWLKGERDILLKSPRFF